jgi:hypothetical protein
MDDMPRAKWARISRETLEIYAPIAHRLGLNQTYRELQDLSFRHLHPWRYTTLSRAVAKARSRRRDLIQKVQRDVEASFGQAGLAITLSGREKTLYSIYRKMDTKVFASSWAISRRVTPLWASFISSINPFPANSKITSRFLKSMATKACTRPWLALRG